METPQDKLLALVCSQCEGVLRRGPVFQRHDGAAVCGVCQEQEGAAPASRWHLYETVASLLLFPCRYQEEGCSQTVPFIPAGSEGSGHEDTCEYRVYVCPLLGPVDCEWSGRRAAILQHCRDQHPDRVLDNPATITPDIRHSLSSNFLLTAFHLLFLVHTRVCVTSASLYYAVRLLGESLHAADYTFTLTFRRGEDIINWTRGVLQQERLILKQHSALQFSINSLLRMLGGWDGATLVVEVRQRDGPGSRPRNQMGAGPREAEAGPREAGAGPKNGVEAKPKDKAGAETRETEARPREVEAGLREVGARPRDGDKARPRDGAGLRGTEAEQETCGECEARTVRLYRDKDKGWFCECCAPNMVTCRNQGCDFLDFPGKTAKHSWWWCERRTKCWVCEEYLRGATPAQHYPTCRGVMTGDPCLVPRDGPGRWFLVESGLGRLLCESWYTGDRFRLRVYAPVSGRQLPWYRCGVRLECAGHTCTFTPDLLSSQWFEWEVDCRDRQFLSGPDVRFWLDITRTHYL